MKKLIYIFLLSVMFVACDKGNDSIDLQVLAPAEKEIVSGDFNMSSIDIDGLISRLTASTAKNEKKSSSLTSKDGVAGTSYISLYTGIVNGNLFEIAFDDTQSFCVPDASGLNYLTLFYNASGGTELKFGNKDAATIVTIEGLGFLFELDINQGVRINGSTKVVTQATLSNNIFTF